MKKIFALLMMTAAVFSSCSKVESDNGFTQTGVILKIRMSGADTKAVTPMPGVAELNENKVNILNYYIFNGETLLDFGSQAAGRDITSEGMTINLGYSEEKFAEVFAEGNDDLRIYVVANAASELQGKTITTPAELGAVALETATTGKQNIFVMAGDAVIAEVESGSDMRIATAEVSLKRIISKVSLKINLASTFQKDADSPVWTPATNSIKVVFHNLETSGQISGAPVNGDFVDAPAAMYTAGAVADGYYPCTASVPYYTYPRAWAFGDETQPYFLVEIPWASESETVKTYYKVILSNRSFDSNCWYAVNVTLKGLGSLTPGLPTEVEECTVAVADWKVSVDGSFEYHTEASFTEARVLDIPQENVLLYNQNTASFSFFSTHDCKIKSVVLNQMDFSQAGAVRPETTTLDVSDYPFSIDNSAHVINFSHELKNDITSADGFDYRDYTYVVTICHADAEGEQYEDVITVVQRPSLTISSELNSAGKGNGSNWNNYVNGSHNTSSSNYGGTVNQLNATNSNNNPNMFIISASVLSGFKVGNEGSEKDVQIGDPRSSVPESWASSTTLPDVYGNERTLENYYRTDENKNNVIAPKFRVASSWGKTYELSYDNAVHRCSSYQEDGYPAGRWRIPTEAEVRFMMTLSGKGYIDVLFNNGSYYWCNSCRISNDKGEISTDDSNTNTAVRCVYDEWYWEQSRFARVGKNAPTWGDMKRENFE